MKPTPGLELLADAEGEGRAAAAGDTVVYELRVFLNRGDEVALDAREHTTVLGERRAIAGIEYALVGMRVGGHRRVRIAPHLAYREHGVPGRIPGNAVLEVELWLRAIR